ncbi:hypothetical protein F5Y16DRAFT_131951 [Xylariaceae sp. FL0255]|nr:hypothetical protein F5Y16DRAFT_131951 [Xylariaceae sp. FL0255]
MSTGKPKMSNWSMTQARLEEVMATRDGSSNSFAEDQDVNMIDIGWPPSVQQPNTDFLALSGVNQSPCALQSAIDQSSFDVLAMIESEDGLVSNSPTTPHHTDLDTDSIIIDWMNIDTAFDGEDLLLGAALDQEMGDQAHSIRCPPTSANIGTNQIEVQQSNNWDCQNYLNEIFSHTVHTESDENTIHRNGNMEPPSFIPKSQERTHVMPRRLTINKRQKNILNHWISRNPELYPSREEKRNLSTSTGLTINQISGWFVRARQRSLKRVQSNALTAAPGGASKLRTRQYVYASDEYHSFTGPDYEPLSLFGEDQDDKSRVSDRQWPKCKSLPAASKIKICVRKTRSLPHIFTLDIMWPDASMSHQSSQAKLSLDVAAPTHQSNCSTDDQIDTQARVSTPKGFGSTLRSLRAGLSLLSIEAWIQDVIKNTSYSSKANNSTQKDLSDERERVRFGYWKRKCLRREKSRYLLTMTSNHTQPDAMSSARSNASSKQSSGSAASYMTLGPRKGRRIAFKAEDPVYGSSFSDLESTSSGSETSSSDSDHASRSGRRVTLKAKVSGHKQSSNAYSDGKESWQPSSSNSQNQDLWDEIRDKIFECTFCPKRFSRYCVWKRHEESVHAPRIFGYAVDASIAPITLKSKTVHSCIAGLQILVNIDFKNVSGSQRRTGLSIGAIRSGNTCVQCI